MDIHASGDYTLCTVLENTTTGDAPPRKIAVFLFPRFLLLVERLREYNNRHTPVNSAGHPVVVFKRLGLPLHDLKITNRRTPMTTTTLKTTKTKLDHLDDAQVSARALRGLQDFAACTGASATLDHLDTSNFYCLLEIICDQLDAAHEGIARAARDTVKAA